MVHCKRVKDDVRVHQHHVVHQLRLLAVELTRAKVCEMSDAFKILLLQLSNLPGHSSTAGRGHVSLGQRAGNALRCNYTDGNARIVCGSRILTVGSWAGA